MKFVMLVVAFAALVLGVLDIGDQFEMSLTFWAACIISHLYHIEEKLDDKL